MKRQPAATAGISDAALSDAPPSDGTLVREYQSGSEEAARELYLRYASRLRALAVAQCGSDLSPRFDADDIVQSVFRTFFQRVRRGCYDVPAGTELWGLFLVLALRKVRSRASFHRAAKRDVRLTAGGDAVEQAEHPMRHDESACTFLRMVIDETLEGVRPANRAIIRLRIENHEVAEIAHRTGRSKRTVERVLQEFRQRLADLFPDEPHAAPQHDTPPERPE